MRSILMRRSAQAVLLAAALAFSLSACIKTPQPTGSESMTVDEQTYREHVQAKTEIETLYKQTIAIVGEGGWGKSEGGWGGCGKTSLPETDSWSRLIQWHGPLGRSPEEIATEVAELWTRLGYPVFVESDNTLDPPRKVVSYPRYLTGSTKEGFGAVFSVGDDFANLRGFSRCVTPYPDLLDRYPDNETDR